MILLSVRFRSIGLRPLNRVNCIVDSSNSVSKIEVEAGYQNTGRGLGALQWQSNRPSFKSVNADMTNIATIGALCPNSHPNVSMLAAIDAQVFARSSNGIAGACVLAKPQAPRFRSSDADRFKSATSVFISGEFHANQEQHFLNTTRLVFKAFFINPKNRTHILALSILATPYLT